MAGVAATAGPGVAATAGASSILMVAVPAAGRASCVSILVNVGCRTRPYSYMIIPNIILILDYYVKYSLLTVSPGIVEPPGWLLASQRESALVALVASDCVSARHCKSTYVDIC